METRDPGEADTERLREDVARRVMGWTAERIAWAYSDSATCRHNAEGLALVTRDAWRPDEDERQCMRVLERMIALGYEWSLEGRESLYLKHRVVMAARAAGKLPIGARDGFSLNAAVMGRADERRKLARLKAYYAASKHALEGLHESLHRFGVQVCLSEPIRGSGRSSSSTGLAFAICAGARWMAPTRARSIAPSPTGSRCRIRARRRSS